MKIAILTNFFEARPGYSLVSIVADQVRMLHEKGHEAHLFVLESFPSKNKYPVPEHAVVHATVPKTVLIDYQSKKELSSEHKNLSAKYAESLTEELLSGDFKLVLTHDWIFTGWNLPYATTLMAVTNRLPEIKFYHWVHSIPTARRDWWELAVYGNSNNHLVYPNGTDAVRVALQFKTDVGHIQVVPHIKDLRTWFDFSDESCAIIRKLPNIMQAEIVQIYPAGTDRLHAKRADVLLKLFGEIKRRGISVFLLFANQEARKNEDGSLKYDISNYYRLAEKAGLQRGVDFEFASELYPDNRFGGGLSKQVLRELFLCSNLFVYPTREESFGFVAPEAVLSGAKILVLNNHLRMMHELHSPLCIYADFGSYTKDADTGNKTLYVNLADAVIKTYKENHVIQETTMVRRRYNYDFLYRHFYAKMIDAAIAESSINHVL